MAFNNNYGNRQGAYGAYTPPPSLPDVRFFDDAAKKNMRPSIVDADALACARAFQPGDQRDGIKASQLRKFYADVKSLELVWKTQGMTGFAALSPRLKLLKAKVSYAAARKVVPASFKQWLSDRVDQVSDDRDFEAFLLHFEAVVGFAYGEGLKD